MALLHEFLHLYAQRRLKCCISNMALWLDGTKGGFKAGWGLDKTIFTGAVMG
jgi:hypothetical protein